MSGSQNPFYGKHHTQELKDKYSQNRKGQFAGEKHPLFGKHPSDETREKQSEKAKERFENPANHPMSRKVIRLSDLKIYDCMISAAEDNNVCRVTIYRKCRNHKEFMYYDEWLLEKNN